MQRTSSSIGARFSFLETKNTNHKSGKLKSEAKTPSYGASSVMAKTGPTYSSPNLSRPALGSLRESGRAQISHTYMTLYKCLILIIFVHLITEQFLYGKQYEIYCPTVNCTCSVREGIYPWAPITGVVSLYTYRWA